MKKDLFHLLRISACSIAAMAVAACARMAGANEHASPAQPRRSNAPHDLAGAAMLRGPTVVEMDERRIDDLESQLQAVNFELRHLREALTIMGPFEDGSVEFDSIGDAQSHAVVEMAASDTGAEIEPPVSLSDIFAEAPVLDGGRSIFHNAQLADYPTMGAAEADWERLIGEMDLSGLEPRYEDFGRGVRLAVGPLTSEDEVSALCAELSPLAGVCGPERHEGALH